MKSNPSFAKFIDTVIQKQLQEEAGPIFHHLMIENKISVEDYLYTKGVHEARQRDGLNASMARINQTPILKNNTNIRVSKTPIVKINESDHLQKLSKYTLI